MLVLSRRAGEDLIITVPPSAEPQRITVCVVKILSDKVRLGCTASREVTVNRGEIQQIIDSGVAPG